MRHAVKARGIVRDVYTEIPTKLHAKLKQFAAQEGKPVCEVVADWIIPKIEGVKITQPKT